MSALYAIQRVSVDLPLAAGLSAWLPGGGPKLNLLEDVSLEIGAGEIVGLVGESGSGKTTLARAMLGLTPISGGTLRFQGAALGPKGSFTALRRHAAMMFQDPIASLSPRMRVGALLTEPYAIHGIANRRSAADLLAEVGLSPQLATRYPGELSGGQARRVCLARALVLEPALVVADEPTAGLDVSVQGEVLNLMTGLRASRNLGLFIISHNLAMLRHVSDRIAILYLGRMVEQGPTAAVFAAPLHPYTRSLIASEPQPDPRRRRADLAIRGEIPSVLHRPKGCVFHTRCPKAADICRTTKPEMRQLAPGRHVRCHLAEPPLP